MSDQSLACECYEVSFNTSQSEFSDFFRIKKCCKEAFNQETFSQQTCELTVGKAQEFLITLIMALLYFSVPVMT